MKFRKKGLSGNKPSINLTPLLDTVFILLLFFAVSTSFIAVSSMDIDLPEARASSGSQGADAVRVVVTRDNTYSIDGAPVNAADLEAALRAAIEAAPGASLLIEADTASMHGVVIRLIDTGKTVGFEHFAIATEEPAQR